MTENEKLTKRITELEQVVDIMLETSRHQIIGMNELKQRVACVATAGLIMAELFKEHQVRLAELEARLPKN